MNKAIFVDILRDKIKEQGYTQEEFADLIGIGYSTLKKYLSTKSTVMPDANVLVSICDTLGCDVDYLLGRIYFKTHSAKDVYESIGLTEEVFYHLKSLNENLECDDDIKLSTLNQILISEDFKDVLSYLAYARIAHTGFPIKYNSTHISNIRTQEYFKAARDNEDYIDSKEYHASKAFNNLLSKIVECPLEDCLMLFDYMDYYHDLFGERFPLEQFASDEDAALQIKQCLLTYKPITKRKDE